VAEIDRILPRWDARHHHAVAIEGDRERALAAVLSVPAAPDRVVRALLRLRGLVPGGTIGELLVASGFQTLVATPAEHVFGGRGRPWRAGGRMLPLEPVLSSTVAIAVSLRAAPGVLETETRIAAADEEARAAFLRYWRVVAPFSGLIRRRWLRAARRALAGA
jgi:hypothetical protein